MPPAERPWVVVTHVPFEGPALIGEAAMARGLGLRSCAPYDGDAVPDPADLPDIGGLVIMGGPMGVDDEADHPFLAQEKRLLAAAVESGVPVLGVCLGAQLLAAACGAEVTRGSVEEIGLGSVDLTPEGRSDRVFAPAGRALPVLHWHGDTFALPTGAVRLAKSALYPNQAFRLGDVAYGLQFHVEVDEAAVEAMQPHLPAAVQVDRRHLALVTRTGRRLLARYFDRVLRDVD